jgi:arylsulfatase A-like enzyme
MTVPDHRRVVSFGLLSAVLSFVVVASPAVGQVSRSAARLPAARVCAGDCDNDGVVTVDEIVAGVGIAIDGSHIDACASLDADGSALISLDELMRAVASSLSGCVRRPSFLLVSLDDARADGLDRMPHLLARVAGEGVRFENAFVPSPLCAPSRASLLTGLYALRHGTRTLGSPLGGADSFRQSGADQRTIAVWLRASGYRTALFGKYLNAYDRSGEGPGPGGTFYVPPGWDRWHALVSPQTYGGVHGGTYSVIDERAVEHLFDDHTTDATYSTDAEGEALREFIVDSVGRGRPFFAVWAPNAPHVETPNGATPADRHFDTLCPMDPWRPPSWNEVDVTDKPRWVGAQAPYMGPELTDLVRCRAYESLLSVDEQLDETLDLLESLGVDRDTVILVTSDNGVGWGEHRIWRQGKECPYEECLRVPLIVRYPRRAVTAGIVRATPVLNIDVAPTVAALAGLRIPVVVDGRSFASELVESSTPTPDERREDFLIEYWRTVRDDGVYYGPQVGDGGRLRLFFGAPRAQPRPSAVFEFDVGDGVADGAVAVPIGPHGLETFDNLRRIVSSMLAFPGWLRLYGADVLVTLDRSISHDGVYWWEERDEERTFEPRYPTPDYFGVRDVANDFTWIEHETGERELYDLEADPAQLENRADDPAYAEVRARLERRLAELLQEITQRARSDGAHRAPDFRR